MASPRIESGQICGAQCLDGDRNALAAHGSTDVMIQALVRRLRASEDATKAGKSQETSSPRADITRSPYDTSASWSLHRQKYPSAVEWARAPPKNIMSKWNLFPVDVKDLPLDRVPPAVRAEIKTQSLLSESKVQRKLNQHNTYVKCFRNLQQDGWLPYEREMIDIEAIDTDVSSQSVASGTGDASKDPDTRMEDVAESRDEEGEEAEEEVTAAEQARTERNKAIAWWSTQYVMLR